MVVEFKMNCLISNALLPADYQACGNLVSDNSFLHTRRTLSCCVLLLIRRGCLHITQGGIAYDLHPGQVILLLPGKEHYGHLASQGPLSYYWVHFGLSGPSALFPEAGLPESLQKSGAVPGGRQPLEHYVLPEVFTLKEEARISMLFHQLLDFSRLDRYHATPRMRYSLSLLLLELSGEYLASRPADMEDRMPPRFAELLAWMEANYDKPLTAGALAGRCGYHPAYLSALFRRYTGYSVLEYLNRCRILASRNLLENPDLKLEIVAEMCGFGDEKYYMKLFKRFEGVTPSQYREAFFRKTINRE